MRNVINLFASLLLVFVPMACDNEISEDVSAELKEAYVQSNTTPISDGDVTPVILAVDKPRGGNVTCNDVMQAFDNEALICGDKINYDDYLTEEEFEGAFPSWLNVQVDGNYVSFNMTGCGEIEGVSLKVGAVIVKGSNASSVYYYPDGAFNDSGLAAPEGKYMVSNLTFCFVQCDEPEPIILAVKCYYTPGPTYTSLDYSFALSEGTYPFTTTEWCNDLGYNYYPTISSFAMIEKWTKENVGIVTIMPSGNNLIITIDLKGEGVLDETYLYAGPLSGLTGGVESPVICPEYWNWQYKSFEDVNSVQLIVPYAN